MPAHDVVYTRLLVTCYWLQLSRMTREIVKAKFVFSSSIYIQTVILGSHFLIIILNVIAAFMCVKFPSLSENWEYCASHYLYLVTWLFICVPDNWMFMVTWPDLILKYTCTYTYTCIYSTWSWSDNKKYFTATHWASLNKYCALFERLWIMNYASSSAFII